MLNVSIPSRATASHSALPARRLDASTPAQSRAAQNACAALAVGKACSYWLDGGGWASSTSSDVATATASVANLGRGIRGHSALAWGHCYEMDVWREGGSDVFGGMQAPISKAVFCLRDGSFDVPLFDDPGSSSTSAGSNSTAPSSTPTYVSRVSEAVTWVVGGGWVWLAVASPALCVIICIGACLIARRLSKEEHEETYWARMATLPIPVTASVADTQKPGLGSYHAAPAMGFGPSGASAAVRPLRAVRARMAWGIGLLRREEASAAYASPADAAATAADSAAVAATVGRSGSVLGAAPPFVPPPRRGLKFLKGRPRAFAGGVGAAGASVAPGSGIAWTGSDGSKGPNTLAPQPPAAKAVLSTPLGAGRIGSAERLGSGSDDSQGFIAAREVAAKGHVFNASEFPSLSIGKLRPQPINLDTLEEQDHYDIQAELLAAGFVPAERRMPRPGSSTSSKASTPDSMPSLRAKMPRGTAEAGTLTSATGATTLPAAAAALAVVTADYVVETPASGNLLRLPRGSVPRIDAPPLPRSPVGSADSAQSTSDVGDGTCNSRSELLTSGRRRRKRNSSRASGSSASASSPRHRLHLNTDVGSEDGVEGETDYFIGGAEQAGPSSRTPRRTPRRTGAASAPPAGRRSAASHGKSQVMRDAQDQGRWEEMDADLRASLEDEAAMAPIAMKLLPPSRVGSGPNAAKTIGRSRLLEDE